MPEPMPSWLTKIGPTYLTDDIAVAPLGDGYFFLHTIPVEEYQATPGWCVGQFQFPPHGLVSRDPLTVEGSILCVTHGTHGWIRDGRWVAA